MSEDGVDGNLVDDGREHERATTPTLGVQFGEGGGDVVEVDVEAGQTARASAREEDEPILLEGIDAAVGGLLPMYFQYGDAEGIEKHVPMLDARLPEYADLAP